MRVTPVLDTELDMNAVSGAVSGTVDQRPLGQILADLGCLRQSDIENVLQFQRRHGLRFGEAARKLRLVKKADLQRALAINLGIPVCSREKDS
jgi:hypothetical protein